MFRQTITITITITRNIREAYYYYYYFPDYYYYYYFPITITFIITVKPKKHNTSRLQSNIQRHLLLLLYHTLPQTHYHRYYHYKSKLKLLWRNIEVIGKVIVYYWQMWAPITIYILTAENLGVCFSFFLENYLMDFSQTLPFSSLYCSQGYKQKSEMCCYFCLAAKCEICQNLPVLAPIYGHF